MDPRRLTLLRHGAAESPDQWAEDFERPLTKHGMSEVGEMARRLLDCQWVPKTILASPAERTWSSAQILAKVFELDDKQVCCVRELYLATAETIWALVQQQPATLRHLLICGHNPGLSDLASRFGHKPRRHELGTAGVVKATFPDTSWDELSPRSTLRCEFDDPDSIAER